MTTQRYDERIFELIPHRPPMLLINAIEGVTESASSALVYIDSDAPFYEPGVGVPAWIGLEYMGQTAALIAGYQLQQGLVSPHLGFLLGTRSFKAHSACFTDGVLKVSCQQQALVGEGLATFKCIIENYAGDGIIGQCVAEANLSVFRREIT